MRLKQNISKQLKNIIIASLSGIIIGGFIFIMNIHSNIHLFHIPSFTIVAHQPSISTIESYLNQGQFQNAYEEALRYKERYPNDNISFKYLGLTLFQIGKYEESNQNFEHILQNENLNPNEKAEIYYFIARNFDFLKDYDKVLLYNKKAIELNPNDYRPYQVLGQILLKQKKYEEAISYLTKSLTLIPDYETNPLASYPYYYLAKIYFELNNYNQAKEMIDKATKLAEKLNPSIANLFIKNINSLKMEIEKQLNQNNLF